MSDNCRWHKSLLTANTTASGRETRRASSDPACFPHSGKGLGMTADKPGLVINREAFAEVWKKAQTASTPRPQRGQPHVDGPLGGAFLIPRPLAVVDYCPTSRLRRVTYSSQHAPEDDVVQRQDCVPVKDAEQSLWSKPRRHCESCASPVLFRFKFKVQHGFAWQLHFRQERQRAVAVDTDDTPEVERFTEFYAVGVAPAPPKPRASHQRVHPPADAP